MNRKKNKIVIISIIIIIVLVLILGIAYLYSATDMFKSKKTLFFKYASQLTSQEEGFTSDYLEKYFEKKKTVPYNNKGTISFNINNSEINSEQLERTNNCTIAYDGKVDNNYSKLSQLIFIKYSNDVQFPVAYLQSGNKVGLQTQYIGSKYVAVESDKINQISDFINIDLGVFEEKNITSDDILYIKDKYSNLIAQELQDSNFSRIQGEQKGYKLIINGEQLKNIILKILETLKNDETTLEKLNQYTTSKITTKDIEKNIENIDNDSDINNQNFEMVVYQNKGKLSKIEAKINEGKVTIEKIETGNSTQYNFSSEIYKDENTTTLYLNIKYSGLQGLQSITEDYELGLLLDDNNKYIYYLNSNVDFNENLTIVDMTDKNTLLLTQYDEEQVNNFMSAVKQRLEEVNKMQMESLGIADGTNPLVNIIPFSVFSGENSMNNVSFELDQQSVETHNMRFENYAGSDLSGATVKGLLSTIQLSNENNADDEMYQIKEINFNGEEYEATEQNVTLIKSETSTDDSYKVEFEKNENTGLVYRVVINKK